MMRRPAVRTFGLARCASAISWSSTGSPKLRHHSCKGAARAAGSTFTVCSEPPIHESSQETRGRWKSGPTVVQPASSMAATSSAARGPERSMGPEHTASAAVADDFDPDAMREERSQLVPEVSAQQEEADQQQHLERKSLQEAEHTLWPQQSGDIGFQ